VIAIHLKVGLYAIAAKNVSDRLVVHVSCANDDGSRYSAAKGADLASWKAVILNIITNYWMRDAHVHAWDRPVAGT